VTTDLGKGPARTEDAVPRHRGGAHAAAKTGRFRRKSGLAPQATADPAPPSRRAADQTPAYRPALDREPSSRPAAASAAAFPPASAAPSPLAAPIGQVSGNGSLGVPAAVPRPRETGAPRGTGAAAGAAVPDASGTRVAQPRAAAARSAAASLCAVAIVATVVPLVVLQIPDAIAWSLPPRLAAGGPAAAASLLRASGLALPAMAVAGSLAALAVRWLRAGPVLLAGLLALAAADALGDAAHTVTLIGADRSLHGAGAGIAMAAVVAVVAEQAKATQAKAPPQKAGPQKAAQPRAGRQFLAGWWAAFTVAGLAAAPELMRHRVSSGDWHAALQPYPWLTSAALVLAALYAVLSEGTATATARNAFPVAERAHLALLTAPVAGLCAIAVAVTYRGDKAVVAAAIADAVALAGIAAITARAGSAARFAVVCAVTGFTLAPAAGAVTALSPPTAKSGEWAGAALTAALCGAALGVLTRRPRVRAITAAGLFLAATGLGALDLAGPMEPAGPQGRLLALACVPLAAGLAAALAASLRAAGAPGALAGVAILLAGLVAGYLAAGAVQLRALTGARTVAAVHAALVTAAGRWTLVAAAVTGAVALAMACTPGRPRGGRPGGRPDDSAGGAPVPGAGGIQGHG